jgi:hypothetical protein
MIRTSELRTDNVDIRPAKVEFNRLYAPLGNRYLRGLDSYLYNKDKPAISMNQRLKKQNIDAFKPMKNQIIMNIPKSATYEQKVEYIYRQNAFKNKRIDTNAKFQSYNSGLSTGNMNRQEQNKRNIGIIYSTSNRDKSRIQTII